MSRFSLEAIFKGVDRVSGVASKISSNMERVNKRFSKGVSSLNAVNDKVINGLKAVATTAAAVGTAAGAAAFKFGKTGADFEQAITDVGAVSLMTRDQIADLEKRALALGATTKFSATEVANGMELMGRAGFTNAEILQGIGGILSAAAAEGAELAETAGHVSNVLKGMGLATTEATRVADVLTLASARTNSSISSLGESMANVSSTARQFKIPLEDTVAAVALLQDVGLDASEAGSAVNTMLTKLAAPTKEVKAQMRAMGVSFQDAKGNMLPLGDVMAQLAKAADKSKGNMGQVAFFADLVGLRGQKAAANLKDLFKSGKVGELVEELRHAAGSAEKMAKIRMDTLKGDIETLGGSVDTLAISLYNMRSGALRSVVQGFTKWLDVNNELIQSKFNEFIEHAIPLVENFAQGVRDGFKDAMPWIKGVGRGFEFLFGGGSAGPRQNAYMWGERIAQLAVAFGIFSLATKVATAAQFLYAVVTHGAAAASWAATAAQGALALATMPLAGMFGAAALGALAFLGALGLVVAAVLLINDALNELKSVTEGLGLSGMIGEMYDQGTWDPAKAVDAYQNRQAKERFKADQLAKKNAQATAAFRPSDAMPELEQRFKQVDAQVTSPEDVTKQVADLTKSAGMFQGQLDQLMKQAPAVPGVPGPVPVGGMAMPKIPGEVDMAAVLNQAGSNVQQMDIQGSPQIVLGNREALKDSMEITIRDQTDGAEVTQGPQTDRTRVNLEQSGSF